MYIGVASTGGTLVTQLFVMVCVSCVYCTACLKGDRTNCDNHRGISLLSVVEKVLARIMLTRLSDYVASIGILPESQCGFRTGRSTIDMIFSLRQLQEKCIGQHKDLYLIFVNLTKAFDTVNREGLWAILSKIGCPDKFVNIIRSFHDGMLAHVIDGGYIISAAFSVTSGTKQGCLLAPLLFSIFFSLLLDVAFKTCNTGIPLVYRTDRNLFDLRKLQAKNLVHQTVVRELMFADDCALAAHNIHEAQHLLDFFVTATRRFGLSVSIQKSEVMFQPQVSSCYLSPVSNNQQYPASSR